MLEIDVLPMWPLLATALAFLVPMGISLIVAGGLAPRLARHVALAPLVAFTLATIGYVMTGFALHYGGIGLIIDHPDLQGLVWEWSALSANWGATWGMAGVTGFGLSQAQGAVATLLLLTTLPWATTATLLPLLALRGRAPRGVVALVALLVAWVGYPLVGNWIQGGGWLSRLGQNIGAGHGFVDIGGAAVFLLGGSITLAAMLMFVPQSDAPEERDALPPVHLPLLAVSGAGLLVAGTAGWLLASPLNDWTQMLAVRAVVHVLLAAAGGATAPLAYTWLVANQPDPLQGARGVAAGWVAGLALAPLVSPLVAVGVGLVAGLLLVFGTYVLSGWLQNRDPGALLTTFGLPAIWGLLALGLFADGSAGVGWNGVGPASYLGMAGQGITGLYAAAAWMADGGQWQAQAVGVAAVFLLGFLATTVLTGPLVLVGRAWASPSANSV
ncbi:MAG: hypothetical protein GXP37_12830, partial [Chloroflexi bacterium]|nr:hypothetical protein [Chloroflexota bacterium]